MEKCILLLYDVI